MSFIPLRPRSSLPLCALMVAAMLFCATAVSAASSDADSGKVSAEGEGSGTTGLQLPGLADLFKNPPHVLRKKVNAEWQLWYLQIGTRSEGIHGRLYIDDVEQEGNHTGDTLQCALGTFVWQGSTAARAHLWSDSGWLPAGVDVRSLKNGKYLQMAGYAAAQGLRPMRRMEKGDAVWVFWKESRSAPGHGDLSVNGHWLTGDEQGEKNHNALGDFVWQEYSPKSLIGTGWKRLPRPGSTSGSAAAAQ